MVGILVGMWGCICWGFLELLDYIAHERTVTLTPGAVFRGVRPLSTNSNSSSRQPSWRELLRQCAAWPLRLLLPPRCVLCGAAGQPPALDLCAACEADLPGNFPACGRCAAPLQFAAGAAACGACQRRAPRFDAAFCAFAYDYPVDHMVRAVKYHGAAAYARVLGELLAARLQAAASVSRPELLLPVPLGPVRFRQRGYNQAIELGRYLERRLGIAMRTDLLLRSRETSEQAGLPRQERRRNIRRAFALRAPVAAAHVALIDDVITTGSTVNELARLLKASGVRRVDVWAVARVSPHF
jgi:ComF family protein